MSLANDNKTLSLMIKTQLAFRKLGCGEFSNN